MSTSKKRPVKGTRLKPYTPIKTLPADRPLCPTSVPSLPMGKFTRVDGQMVLDFGEDEGDDAA
jgi:hypothetical protein